MIHGISALVVCIAVWFIGCAASQPSDPNPIGKVLLGKSTQDLVSCAGNPLQETKTAEGTVLKYDKEASMLEESFPFSKGSRAGAQQGCWASLLLAHDRVTAWSSARLRQLSTRMTCARESLRPVANRGMQLPSVRESDLRLTGPVPCYRRAWNIVTYGAPI